MGSSSVKLRRALGVGALAFATAAAGFTVAASPAYALGSDLYVSTTGSDSNNCDTPATACKTIAYAVSEFADTNDTVHVAAGTYPETDNINIYKNLTIEGAADGVTKVTNANGDVVDVGNECDGVPTVTLKNLTITSADGDGVYAACAALNFVNSHVDGSIDNGVDAYDSVIDATNSTFSGNGSTQHGYGDGVYLAYGALTADHSTFDGNVGYGVWLSPYADLAASEVSAHAANGANVSARLDHSTASNNGYAGVGGYDASIQVWSSTLSGNTGAGIENDSGRSQFGFGEVRNSTITGTKPWPVQEIPKVKGLTTQPAAGILTGAFNNDVAASRAAKLHAASTHKSVTIKHSARVAKSIAALTPPGDLQPNQIAVSGSIVAEQASGVADCAVSTKYIVDDGYNLSSDAANSCGFAAADHDLITTDPKLGPLADNGGPTRTHALTKGSPAIDVIPVGSAGCDVKATDQRDLARVQPVGGKCDVGAVEMAADPLAIHPDSLPHGTVGKAYSQQLTASGGQFPTYTFKFESGDLPPGLSFSTAGKISGTPTKAGSFTFTVSVNDPAFKTYTIVIDEPAAPNNHGEKPISETGAHTGSMLTLGAGAILAGFLVLLAAGLVGSRRGRHRKA